MKLAMVIVVLFLTACSVQQQALQQDTLPRLILQDPLPPLVSSGTRNLRIDLRMLVDENGDVAYAELVRPAVNPEWDSLARKTICGWKFSPAVVKGKAIRVWMRFPAIVHFAEPKMMELSEIVCESGTLADSLYSFLQNGADFDEIARKHSLSESAQQSGQLGKVNILRYPEEVQRVLTSIRDGAFTSPIHLGKHFIIFKRFALSL